MSEWFERGKRTPADGAQVLADLQGWTRADDKFIVTRYDAKTGLFAGEGHTSRVVRWMPIPPPGRRVRFNWKKWDEQIRQAKKLGDKETR